MNKSEAKIKIEKVINSCETKGQLTAANTYCCMLAERYFPWGGCGDAAVFSNTTRKDLKRFKNFLLKRKRREFESI